MISVRRVTTKAIRGYFNFLTHRLKSSTETLLSKPVCVTQSDEFLFISDTGNDRIIVTKRDGTVLKWIGSKTGFLDGPFEESQFSGPAFSNFDEVSNVLFVADEKNSAIRAVMIRENLVETLYPPFLKTTRKTLLDSFATLFGFGKVHEEITEAVSKRKGFLNPYHIGFSSDGDLVIGTRDYSELYRFDISTKSLITIDQENTQKGLDSFKEMTSDPNFPSMIVPDQEQNRLLISLSGNSNQKPFLLKKVATLGIPAHWGVSVEPKLPENFAGNPKGQSQLCTEEIVKPDLELTLRPGRTLIMFMIKLPDGVKLECPIRENVVWRQSRGSCVDLSQIGGILLENKVTMAQKWMDQMEVDRWAEGLNETDSRKEETEKNILEIKEFGKIIHVPSLVDVGLGSGEVTLDLALYLNLDEGLPTTSKEDESDSIQHQKKYVYNLELGCEADIIQALKNANGAQIVHRLSIRVLLEGNSTCPSIEYIAINVRP